MSIHKPCIRVSDIKPRARVHSPQHESHFHRPGAETCNFDDTQVQCCLPHPNGEPGGSQLMVRSALDVTSAPQTLTAAPRTGVPDPSLVRFDLDPLFHKVLMCLDQVGSIQICFSAKLVSSRIWSINTQSLLSGGLHQYPPSSSIQSRPSSSNSSAD